MISPFTPKVGLSLVSSSKQGQRVPLLLLKGEIAAPPICLVDGRNAPEAVRPQLKGKETDAIWRRCSRPCEKRATDR